MADTLLIIEDEISQGKVLEYYYQSQGWRVWHSFTLAEARQVFITQHFEPLVVLADISLPDGNALDLLEEVRNHSLGGEWIFLTGY